MTDVLVDFYICSQLSQRLEYQAIKSENSVFDKTRDQNIDNARRKLGTSLCRLLKAAIPSCLRRQRCFRLKYTDVGDITHLECSLLVAAHRTLLAKRPRSRSEADLKQARPSAERLLSLVAQLQSLATETMDKALTECHDNGVELFSEATNVNAEDASDVQSIVRVPPVASIAIPQGFHELLASVDAASAEFEYEFVSAISRRMRTCREANDLQLTTVLMSETLLWGLATGLFTSAQISDRDPSILLSLPRLSVLVGVRLLPDSSIGANRLYAKKRLPFVFKSSRYMLTRIARQLNALRPDQLCRLAQWLGPSGPPRLTTGSPMGVTSPPPIDQQSPVMWQANLFGLHKLFKLISSVADQLGVEHSGELNLILQTAIELNDGHLSDDESSDTTSNSKRYSVGTLAESTLAFDARSALADNSFASLHSLVDWVSVTSNVNSSNRMLDPESADNLLSKVHASASNSSIDALRSPKRASSPLMEEEEEESKSSCCQAVDDSGRDGDDSSNPKAVVRKEKPSTSASPPATDLNSVDLGVDSDVDKGLEELIQGCKGAPVHPILATMTASSRGKTLADSTITSRSYKVTLGTKVFGFSDPNDQALNYLPPWQPDRYSHEEDQSETVSAGMSSEGGSSSSSDEQSTDDSDDENEQSAVKKRGRQSAVIGRQCAACLRSFTLLRRRHHCRRCGHIFCSTCCNSWQPVQGLATSDPVRVCDECVDFLSLVI